MKNMRVTTRKTAVGIIDHFRFCPLCLAEGSIEPTISFVRGARDYITCTACGAKWHIKIGKDQWNAGRVQWAELIIDNVDRKGAQLLGRRENAVFWQHMALKGRREMPQVVKEEPVARIVKEKEIIREIVKVRCRHCGSLYLETLDKCPNCGAN